MDIDPQEVRNAWRLDRRGNEEDRTDTVYPLSSSSAEDESVSPESGREDQVTTGQIVVWTIRLAAVTYLGFMLYGLWGDVEIRLRLLHFTTRFLQATARTVGGWGIHTEQLYGEFVDSLH